MQYAMKVIVDIMKNMNVSLENIYLALINLKI